MSLPYMKLVVPTALKQYKNGQLAESVLAPVKTGGRMYAPVAEEFNKMYDAALAGDFAAALSHQDRLIRLHK